jgi:hypothetical protein
VALSVEFKLTGLEYRPLPKAPVRLVLGTPPDWQSASAGHRFVTDAEGTHRFTTSTVLARGVFTRKAKQESGGWMMPDLGGLALTHPGHEPWNFMLEPDPADPSNLRWTLRIAFKRSPEPIRR